MSIYKIVKGNSFKLHIEMQKAYISQNKQMLEDLDMTQVSNLRIELTDMFGDNIPLFVKPGQSPYIFCKQDGSKVVLSSKEVALTFPSTLDEGTYGIRISGKYNGNDFCSIERNLIAIVSHNSKTHIPLGIVEGEQGGLYNTKYWLELNSFDEADVDNTNVWLDASPSVIVYDGNEHTVKLSWTAKKQGQDVVPSSIKIIDGSNVIVPDDSAKSVEVKRTEVGNYAFHMLAVIDGKTFEATASVTIGAKAMYGASSAFTVDALDISKLQGSNATLVNQEITVTTTDEADTVWFVSDVPLRFIQANIEAELKETIKSGLYYYQSAPLVAGENTYTIKSK